MPNKGLFAVALALLIITPLFSHVFFKVPEKSADTTFTKEFSLVLKNYNQNDIALYTYRRQIVIAYAWASWCTYCADELRHLADLKKTYGDKIQILAINRAEPPPTAKAFTDSLGLNQSQITFLLDQNDEFFKSIGGYAMPETVFIDPSGVIVYHQRGPLDVPTLMEKLKLLIH